MSSNLNSAKGETMLRHRHLGRNRKGITLLFVISLIVMFMLMATTFLVISSQYLRGAKSYANSEIFGKEPLNELDQALYIALRDSRDVNNVLRAHGMLTDVYGYNQTIRANVRAGTAQIVANSNDSMIQLVVENPTNLQGAAILLDQNKNSYMGNLLTITQGGMQGITSRIVSHVWDSNTGLHYFRIYPYLEDFYTDSNNLINSLNQLDPVTGTGPGLIINGRPFQGTGAALDPIAGNYEATDSFGSPANLAQKRLTIEALRPNRIGDPEATLINTYVRLGDLHESYDAADYQNLFMSAEIPAVSGGTYSVTTLPSFHRPALIYSEAVRNGGVLQDATMLRPSPGLHPNFPRLASANSTALGGIGNTTVLPLSDPIFEWDVDNDGDLIKDSVWVDPNLPVVTDKSGRSYKRLFAYLIRDMDGRLNLNAHSNPWQQDNGYATSAVDNTLAANERGGAFPLGTVSTMASTNALNSYMPVGQGMGPPEINLRGLFVNNEFLALMYGDAVNGIWGRYGQDITKTSGTTSNLPGPGLLVDTANFGGTTDQNTKLRLYDAPQGLPIFSGSFGAFSDIQGRFATGVDFNGQLVFSAPDASRTQLEIHDNEYERDLVDGSRYGFSRRSIGAGYENYQVDAPFSYAEVERILRGHDNDSQRLPSRLVDLAPTTLNQLNTAANRANTYYNRMQVGGHSFDMPMTPTDFVAELRDILDNNLAFPPGSVALEEQLEDMLPVELFGGLKFDINRIFGDGYDDNSGGPDVVNGRLDADGIVDNHWGLWSPDLTVATWRTINEALVDETDVLGRHLDLDFDGAVADDIDEHLVRYRYAKGIYVMLRTILRTSGVEGNPALVVGAGNDLDNSGGVDINDLAIFCAQVAINIVDFKDKDSIMTPFEFDLNPFDGWQVDGNPLFNDVFRDGLNNPLPGPINEADRFVVFGCERPNLLLTESFAFHDRRTEDRDDEAGGSPDDKNGGDTDSDQRLKPEGSMFIELYNPNGTTSSRTADLYDGNGVDTASNNGVDLFRVSATNGVNNTGAIATKPSPVWRIVMTRDNIDLDRGNSQASRSTARQNVERVLYFVVEDNGDATADPGEYTRAELRYDLPARVVDAGGNGMFFLSRPVYTALQGVEYITGLESAVIGTAKFPIGGTNAYINPLGRRSTVDSTNEANDVQYDETRSITIQPGFAVGAVVVRDLNAGGNPVDYQKTTLGIPVEGLNISEPIGGYNMPANVNEVALTTATSGGTQYTETVYFDSGSGMGHIFDEPLDRSGRPPGGTNDLDNFDSFFNNGENATRQAYRVLHLQRLANPVVGWHPETNPYLTVDSMPVDLSVFDGAGPGDDSGGPNSFDAASGFGTKERGENTGAARNLWRVEGNRNQGAQLDATATHRFSYYLEHPSNGNVEEESLGGTKLPTAGGRPYINHVFDYENNGIYGGNPKTFPNLAWNNRPFVSAHELMLVPHTTSSQLLRRYSEANAAVTNLFVPNADSANNGFNHLVNFFQGSQGGAAGTVGPDFHRLFDYVTVPSRFANTESYLNPDIVTGFGSPLSPDPYLDVEEALNLPVSVADGNDPLFAAPNNLISKYRDPGRINLNTIYTPDVWNGLNGGLLDRGGHSYASPAGVMNWNNFVDARRGYSNIGNPVLGAINAPTYFPTPFKSSNSGNLVPNIPSLNTGSPVNNGLNRAENTNIPLLDSFNRLINVNRQPYHKFMARSRLSNLTTTRSNVYAVWITVGYFEFDEATGQLGEEIGSLTGDVERHRAFYMIDRSIPVGFEPGRNHNVDKTIKLRRYIE